MKLDVKSLIIGGLIGWYVTVSRASIAITKRFIKEINEHEKGEKEAE